MIKRYKRFLADIALPNGEIITAHCPNTGSMLGCAEPGSTVWLSRAKNLDRKYPLTWEILKNQSGTLIGINTGLSNRLVKEAIEGGLISSFSGYNTIRTEVRFGLENSRVDLLLESATGQPDCYIEVKNVTASVVDGIAIFPDAVSARGTKHLRELIAVVEGGERAVLCYCVQRGDVKSVRPADQIDPLYGSTLRLAISHGVEVIAYSAEISLEGITLKNNIPVVCP
ncbi:sugar fermentation stimulation protein A [Sulfurirhabdus autotrophica]|uniref:Sugar fermentation stimulation protein homolog n=1 Tax=Sulfurirhabdus autotrophica TaxID=1706046 RepID=A0A4R3XRE3_9PROT|nr:sugar fermentation stimulation protein A [Sulfurirhabdus autotrophica]